MASISELSTSEIGGVSASSPSRRSSVSNSFRILQNKSSANSRSSRSQASSSSIRSLTSSSFRSKIKTSTNSTSSQSQTQTNSDSSLPTFQGGSSSSSDFFLTESKRDQTARKFRADEMHRRSSGISFGADLAPIAPMERKSNSTEDMTINKLRFDSLGMYGRANQIARLNQCWQNGLESSSSKVQRQLVLISGHSGTGKSQLARSLKADVDRNKGLYVSGKCRYYDATTTDSKGRQPYSGITGACTEICSALADRLMRENGTIAEGATESSELAPGICQQIGEGLGAQLYLMIQLVPVLREIMEQGNPILKDDTLATTGFGQTAHESKGQDCAESKYQLQFAFIRFIKVVCQIFSSPLVIAIDDLQWADRAELDLLEAIVTQHDVEGLLIIGTYRSNEVNDESHMLHRAIHGLENKAKETKSFSMENIMIGNLDVREVHEIIQHLLSTFNDPRTTQLAELCMSRTSGNVYFVLEFLGMLFRGKLLTFNFGNMAWQWSEDEINEKTSISENVVDLLREKMRQLDSELIKVLKLAACLGTTFDYHILSTVWLGVSDPSNPQSSRESFLVNALWELETERFVTKFVGAENVYQWSHDAILEAASSLASAEEASTLRYHMGRALLERLGKNDLKDNVFFVANLLNQSDIGDNDPIELAKLNLAASRRALKMSAFESAAEYVRNGVKVLPESVWQDHYSVALELYSIGAKVESFLGNAKTRDAYCKEVLDQENMPIEDKFEVYFAWVNGLMNIGKIQEAQDLLLKIFRDCGKGFYSNKFIAFVDVIWHMSNLKKTLKALQAQRRKVLTDQTMIGLMHLQYKLGNCFYRTGDARVATTIFRVLQWTKRYGYCDSLPPACAGASVLLSGITNNIGLATKYGEFALALSEQKEFRFTSARAMYSTYALSFHRIRPLGTLLGNFLETYNIGLHVGDTDSASWAIFTYCSTKLVCGKNIETLISEVQMYSRQMEDLDRHEVVAAFRTVSQYLMNLWGKDNQDDPTKMTGLSLSIEELRHYEEHEKMQLAGWYTYRGFLCAYLGDHLQHANIALKNGVKYLDTALLGNILILVDAYLKSISLFAAYGQTRKRKYLRLGLAFRSRIKGWVKEKNPNVQHYNLLVDAELLASKKKMAAVKIFEEGILLAARAGYQNDAALGNERLGTFFKSIGQEEDATYRFAEAKKYYRNWGAFAKLVNV